MRRGWAWCAPQAESGKEMTMMTTRKILLGGDFGTNGLKLLAYDAEADCVRTSSYQPYTLHIPRANTAEHAPEDYWTALRAAIAQCKALGRFEAKDVAAISLSCHIPTMLPLDESGKPLTRGMIWADNRSNAQCKRINAAHSDFLLDKNPAGVRPYHLISKCSWFIEEEPELYARTKIFLQCNGYVVFRLTGRYSIDHSIAANIHYYNVHEYRWDPETCARFGMDIRKLPPIFNSDAAVGTVLPSVAVDIGLDPETLVAAGGADSSVAPLGVGCVEEGDICYSAGTGASMVSVYDCARHRFNTDKRLITIGSTVEKRILNVAVVAAAGGSFKWARQALCETEAICARSAGEDVFEIMNRQVQQSTPTANGLLFLPYVLGELAPFYNPDARGVFFGISDTTTKRDLLRAVMEGTCYSFRQNLKILENLGGFGEKKEIVATGGPAASAIWMQLLADISGYRISILENTLGAPYGDVILAGVAAGIYPDQVSMAKRDVRIARTYEPESKNQAKYDAAFQVYDEISNMLQPSFEKLGAVRE